MYFPFASFSCMSDIFLSIMISWMEQKNMQSMLFNQIDVDSKKESRYGILFLCKLFLFEHAEMRITERFE